ncbi:MAG: sulfurtransferase [Corynebacterium sp.]|uniref:sulfurtransferase n=1 Tax=Corynebacterium sp. TaxID=1720 RepID=UPI0026DFA74B|nr:sulfurtransferase [Corynebacterium sp.]MDO5669847.1 sulfurtransferase [Corynebacterium sp.]
MATPLDPHPPFQEYAHPERLVSASWLSARLGTPGLRVIESDEDPVLYDIGHLPGAVRIDWQKDLNDPVTRDIIDAEGFAALMRAKGINRDDTVVIYGDQSNWWAAFTLWVFELFGHEDVRLLDGGRDAWMAEERDTSFVVPEFPESDYPVVERRDANYRVFVDEMLNKIDNSTIVDVRSPEEFNGLVGADDAPALAPTLRRGHIPSAVNVPWQDNVHPNSLFRSRAELEKLYSSLDPQAETTIYCHVGDRTAHTWFVLKYLLGFRQVRNYDGSWVEWGNMVRMPIARGEAPPA